MEPKYKYYIFNKVFSFITFVSFYYIISLWQKNIEKTLSFSITGMIIIGMSVNILYGLMIGWFLWDDIALKFNKKFNIITVCILVVLSCYKFMFYFMSDNLNYVFVKFTNYFQWALGIYICLILQYYIKNKKETYL